MQSCAVMYSPSMQNVPLLQEKNEVRATVGFSDFQGAYAFSDKFAVMLNGYYNNGASMFNNDTYFSSYSYERKSQHIEAGGGYFKHLNDNAIIECYGGLGFGSSTFKKYFSDSLNSIPKLNSSFLANTNRFFIQPSIGYSIDYFDVAFSTRIQLLSYSNVNSNGFSAVELYDYKLLNIDQPVFFFLEPALTMRFGYKYVKFHAQAVFSYKYNTERLHYIPFVFNVGIHVNISDRFKEIKKKKSTSSYYED